MCAFPAKWSDMRCKFRAQIRTFTAKRWSVFVHCLSFSHSSLLRHKRQLPPLQRKFLSIYWRICSRKTFRIKKKVSPSDTPIINAIKRLRFEIRSYEEWRDVFLSKYISCLLQELKSRNIAGITCTRKRGVSKPTTWAPDYVALILTIQYLFLTETFIEMPISSSIKFCFNCCIKIDYLRGHFLKNCRCRTVGKVNFFENFGADKRSLKRRRGSQVCCNEWREASGKCAFIIEALVIQ